MRIGLFPTPATEYMNLFFKIILEKLILLLYTILGFYIWSTRQDLQSISYARTRTRRYLIAYLGLRGQSREIKSNKILLGWAPLECISKNLCQHFHSKILREKKNRLKQHGIRQQSNSSSFTLPNILSSQHSWVDNYSIYQVNEGLPF